MKDQGREVDALTLMSLEVGIEIQQDPISICAKNAKLDCRCFSDNGIHYGWA